MKSILLTILIMYLLLNFNMLIMIASLFMITFMFLNHKMMITNYTFQDNMSMMLSILTIISILLILLSSPNMKEISKMIILIFINLIITFSINSMIMFYILFELVLIPTTILVMKSGKQPERLQAGIYLLMYTILASIPLLVNIISLKYHQSFTFATMLMLKTNLTMTFFLAFLVKSPMFMMHLWLPKAHVEAPLEGSMILAAILLKLGGYGLIRFIPLCMTKMKSNNWIISISMIGALSSSMNCMRQKDLKSLIAYSSVAHMGFMLMGLFSLNNSGLQGSIMMMLAHGLSSSALFLLVNDMYMKYHSRNISSFKGLLTMSPNITFWWFMFMAINISAPPTINTISEILIMSSMIFINKTSMIMIFLISLSVTSFSMLMFINISHNKNEMNPSTQTPHKIFLSLIMHMLPLMMFLSKMDMMLS